MNLLYVFIYAIGVLFSQCFYLIVDRIIELQRDIEYKVIVDENSGLTLDMYVMCLCTECYRYFHK